MSLKIEAESLFLQYTCAVGPYHKHMSEKKVHRRYERAGARCALLGDGCALISSVRSIALRPTKRNMDNAALVGERDDAGGASDGRQAFCSVNVGDG